jgi:hypothetical protein
VCATSSEDVWILLGNGDGTFRSVQSVAVGQEPHGIVALDVDGDGDLDIVNCNRGSRQPLAVAQRRARRVRRAGVLLGRLSNGEYGLAAGDMDKDGITDLVVAGQSGSHLRTLRGNGDGTFTAVGERAGDRRTDVGRDARRRGRRRRPRRLDRELGQRHGGHPEEHRRGRVRAVATVNLGAHTPSTDLGDLDGDGDLDWVLSSFGGGFWRLYRNDGSGSFTFWTRDQRAVQPVVLDPARHRPRRRPRLALTDEIADVVVLMRNQ